MVQAINNNILQERSFDQISRGNRNTKQIEGTRASLIDLPTMGSTEQTLIATHGPSSERSAHSFWKDLVMKHDATLIVNLCGDVASGLSNNGYWSECVKYWATAETQTIEIGGEIRVSVLEQTQLCETLNKYVLHVQ